MLFSQTTTLAKSVVDKLFQRDDRRRTAHGGARRKALLFTLTSASPVAESSFWATPRTPISSPCAGDCMICLPWRTWRNRWRLAVGSREETDLTLLALLEWQYRIDRWMRFPETDRAAPTRPPATAVQRDGWQRGQ